MKKPLSLVLLLGMSAVAMPLQAEELEQRVQKLEQLVNSQGLVDMFLQMQALQQEVQELRGQVEQQTFAIESLKQRQRDLYLDIDRRMRKLEGGGAPATTTPSASRTTPPASTQATSSGSADEDTAYRDAFNLLKEGRYQTAIKRFTAFLKKYPASGYADNAQYWLGEANYVTRNYQQAITEFNQVVVGYPQSNKRADALLKIGYCQYELKDFVKAKEALSQVVRDFPKTTAARLADNRLQRMQLEGQGAPAPAQ